MDAFKSFYSTLTPDQREAFAKRIGTTPGYCHQLAYGKRLELGLADVIVAVAPEFKGQIKLEDLNLTDRARTQDAVRKSVSDPVANAPWDGGRRIAAS
jgi:hypothetical protein